MGRNTLYTDDFNRADESPIAGDWEAARTSEMRIVSNQLAQVDEAGSAGSRITTAAQTFPNNQWAQAQIATLGTIADYPIIVRSTGTASPTLVGFFVNTDGSVEIQKAVSGSFETVVEDTTAGIVTAGDTMRLEMESTMARAYVNGSEVLRGFITDVTTGQPGLGGSGSDNVGRWDNFEAGEFVAAGIEVIRSI